MLVAGASLSLLAPIAAQASNVVNLEEMNVYARSKSKPKKFDSKTFINKVNDDTANLKDSQDALEVYQNKFEAGGFSDTTTLDGYVLSGIGAVQGANELTGAADGVNENVVVPYVYQMNLNTSFFGDDNLYVRLKTGDGWSGPFGHKPGTYHINASDKDDLLNVDKLWYSFPIGPITATYGPKIENYYMLAATPSVYKPGALKGFKLGGHASAFGASTSQGFGLKYVADNGFAISTTLNSKDASGSDGLLTDEDRNKLNTMVAYTGDNYHLSATYSRQKGWDSWQYYSTYDLKDGVSNSAINSDSVALRAWWRPEETGTATPSISVGYDVMTFSGRTDVAEGSGFFVGFNWSDMFQPDDKIGLAFGSPMKATIPMDGANLTEVDPTLYELYYSFRPNDNIEITPAVFGGSDIHRDTDDDIFGAFIQTKFKF